jgi:hypothetical protein
MRQERGTLVLSPSDLSAYVACPHLTTLELGVARGELVKPYRHNPHADLIRRKGNEHEARYLASVGDVVEIGKPWEIGWDEAAALTEQAVQDYVIVHELLHLRLPQHNKLFKALMTTYVPDWRKLEASVRERCTCG